MITTAIILGATKANEKNVNRLVTMCREYGVMTIVLSYDHRPSPIGSVVIFRDNPDEDCDAIMAVRKAWMGRVVVLKADVFYDPNAFISIMICNRSPMFFTSLGVQVVAASFAPQEYAVIEQACEKAARDNLMALYCAVYGKEDIPIQPGENSEHVTFVHATQA